MRSMFSSVKRVAAIAGLSALVAAVTFAVAPVRGAAAQTGDWGAGDPVLSVNGQQVNVIGSVQGSTAEIRAAVDHAQYTITLPRGVDAKVVAYLGELFTERAEFVFVDDAAYKDGDDVVMHIALQFTASAALPAQLEVMANGARTVIGLGNTISGVQGSYTLASPLVRAGSN